MVQRKDIKTEDIVRLYQSGLIGREIAEKLSCSVPLVQQRLAKAGIKMRPSNDRITVPIDKTVLKEMYWDKQMHPAEIGKAFGVHKMTITKKMLEFGVPFRTKSEARKGDLNPIFHVGHSLETRQKMSDLFLDGRRKVSLTNQYGTPTLYKGILYRSSWEAGAAFYLDDKKVPYFYEYNSFKYPDVGGIRRTYTPDFYLPEGLTGEGSSYIEVKGSFRERDQSKIDHCIREHGIKVLMWDTPVLIELGIINTAGKIIIGGDLIQRQDVSRDRKEPL
jgi:hypothetical protein